MTSCGAGKSASVSGDNSASDNAGGDNQSGSAASADQSAGDSQSSNNTDIFGEISNIVGNLATVNLAVMPSSGVPVPGNAAGGGAGNGIQGMTLDKNNLPAGVTINDDGSISYNGTKVDGVTVSSDGTLTVTDPSALRSIFGGANGGNFNGRNGNGGNSGSGSGANSSNADNGGNAANANGGNNSGGIGGNGGAQYYVGGGANGADSINAGSGGGTYTFGNGNMGNIPTDSSGNRIMPTDSSGNPVARTRGAGGAMSGMNGTPMNYTGSSTDFIIPVGFPLYALTHDDKGNNVETEIQLTDIQAGNIIDVTYKPDGKTIDKILISQVTAMTPDEMSSIQSMRNNRDNAGAGTTDTSGNTVPPATVDSNNNTMETGIN